MQLNGKAAFVTGSTSGIGLGIARALAQAGCDVALNARSSTPETEALATALAEGRPVPHQVAMAATSADYAAGDDASATLAKR